jgi:hypothetical protein
MGLVIATAKLIVDEAMERPFHGSILQLGLQDLTFSEKQFFRFATDRGFDVKADRITEPRGRKNGHSPYITNSAFFKYLGFSEINSLDYSDYDGSNILFDLNNSVLPDDLHERFDFVLDGGTLEHIFNTPHALSHIISMCKVGGRIMHISPSSNQVNHGFYSFSPTLFFDFYHSNNFTFHRFYLVKLSASGKTLYGLDLKQSKEFVADTIRLNSRIYNLYSRKETAHYSHGHSSAISVSNIMAAKYSG